MAKTLVVKLAGTVDNPDLRKLGELRFNIVPVGSLPPDKQYTPSGNTQDIQLKTNRPILLELTGSGHFTDETLTQNLGTRVTTLGDVSTLQTFYVSDSTSTLHVYDKYAINQIALPNKGRHYAWSFDFGELEGITAMQSIYFHSAVYTAERSLDIVSRMPYLYWLVALTSGGESVQLKGDLSVLSELTRLLHINLDWQRKITGNISSLAGLTHLRELHFEGLRNVTGDTSSLAHLHPNNGGQLATFLYSNSGITGEWPPSA